MYQALDYNTVKNTDTPSTLRTFRLVGVRDTRQIDAIPGGKC